MLRLHLGDSPEPLTVDKFHAAVRNVRYQLQKGVDLSHLPVTEATETRLDWWRVGVEQPARLDGVKRLDGGPEVGQSKEYYDRLVARMPEVVEAALPQPEARAFSRAARISLYESERNSINFDDDPPTIRTVDLRRMMREPRRLVPGESDQFYELCTAIRRELSRDTLRGTPIETKLQNLDAYTEHSSPEERRFFTLLINKLLTEDGVKLEGLCDALEKIQERYTLNDQLAAAVRILGDRLRHDLPYQKEIGISGVVTPKELFYVGSITLWRAGQGDTAFAGTPLAGISEARQHEILASLPKLALPTGGEDFRSKVAREVNSWRRDFEIREKLRPLREATAD